MPKAKGQLLGHDREGRSLLARLQPAETHDLGDVLDRRGNASGYRKRVAAGRFGRVLVGHGVPPAFLVKQVSDPH